jgi:DNA invertase Pin-like site-specific DNA recombinase
MRGDMSRLMAQITPPAPLAYSYIRMSTDVQLKGDSLRRQTALSRQYAEQHGLRLVHDFKLEDIGVSAFKSDNVTTGALSRFLQAVRAKRIPSGSFLLVESLDRLSRDKITTALQLFLSITEGGVNIVTLSDGQVYRAGETEFPQLIYSLAIMMRANDESKRKTPLRKSSPWLGRTGCACRLIDRCSSSSPSASTS